MAAYNFTITLDSSGNGELEREIHGELASVFVNVTGHTATPDIDIAEQNGMKQTVLSVDNVADPTVYYPRVPVQDSGGTALVYAGTDGVPDRYMLNGRVKVSVAGGDASEQIEIWVQTY